MGVLTEAAKGVATESIPDILAEVRKGTDHLISPTLCAAASSEVPEVSHLDSISHS